MKRCECTRPPTRRALATRSLHRWAVSPKQAIAIQRRLAGLVIRRGTVPRLRLAAGADVAFLGKGECIAGVVVWDVVQKKPIEQQVARKAVRFPYVPGLLTFRETPAVLAALRKLRSQPDVFLFDGQGIAHPRRIGFAAHTGLLIDRPTIGCAKSLLTGEFEPPGPDRGAASPLVDGDEVIGMTVRTRDRAKPMFISIGHRISLAEAVRVAVRCCNGFRVPEPTRLADLLVGRTKRELAGD